MTKKTDVLCLKDFNPSHFLVGNEDISAYIRVVEEEGDISEYSHALNTVFLAIGANAVAKALGVSVEQVWNVQEQPAEHSDDLKNIVGLLKEGLPNTSKTNPYMGSNFEDFLEDEGIYDEVTAAAIRQLKSEILKQSGKKER
jgi:DNA-binding phage protein